MDIVDAGAPGDFDADDEEIDRLFGRVLVLVEALLIGVVVVVVGRLGEGGRTASSLTVAGVKTVKEGADDNIANEDNGDELLGLG